MTFCMLHQQIEADKYETCEKYQKIKVDKGITWEDEVTLTREGVSNYDQLVHFNYLFSLRKVALSRKPLPNFI